MASSQRSVSEYFPKDDSGKSSLSSKTKESNKGESNSNPSKRTRRELSSTGSDLSDQLNQRILDDLDAIKKELQKTVKTTELDGLVRKVVEVMMKGLKMTWKLNCVNKRRNTTGKWGT